MLSDVTPCWQIRGVGVIFVEDWLKTHKEELRGLPYMGEGRILREWLDTHNGHYYCATNNQFSIYNAVKEAKSRNCRYVVVERI